MVIHAAPIVTIHIMVPGPFPSLLTDRVLH